MRICIVGAGAIGGLIAVRLSQIGEELSAIARGAHLAAIREHGLKLLAQGAEQVARVRATDQIAEVGPQDVIVLALKAHQVASVAPDLSRMLGPDTIVITAQNGIPWWYFLGQGGPYGGTQLESVDPGGVIAKHLDPKRVIGSIIYPASEIVAPGVIRHIEGDRISFGELDGKDTQRLRQLVELFRKAGFRARGVSDIRSEIWLKLWGNLTFNPVSALTHATLLDLCRFPLTRALATSMMREAQTVAEKLGVSFPLSIEKRIAGAESVGEHKTSMLQDVESGRPLEIEALIGSVIELGTMTGTPTPHLDAVYACASLLAKRLRDSGGTLRLTSAEARKAP